MSYKKKDMVSSLIKRIDKVLRISQRIRKSLQSELLKSTIKEIEQIEDLVSRSITDPAYTVELLKRVYKIVKKKPPDEPTRRRK